MTDGKKCPKCKGDGEMMCPRCEGTGCIEPSDAVTAFVTAIIPGVDNDCPRCGGSGFLECDKCNGSGEIW